MTFGEYITTANRHYLNNKGAFRQGQAYYNTLAANRPDLADRVVGTALDPFYADHMVPGFLDFLAENW